MKIHPAVQEELDMLRERFPGVAELTLDEYAAYWGIARRYASQHFSRANGGAQKIGHKRIGRRIIIPVADFAYWLASKKIVDGAPLVLPAPDELKADMKNRRGFGSSGKTGYRALG